MSLCCEGTITLHTRPANAPTPAGNENPGTEIIAAEFRPACVLGADTFMGCQLSEEGTCCQFFVNILLSQEEFSFVRVHGHETFLAIGVPYPEIKGTDLFLYADDLPHGAAAVPTALAYKGYF